MPYYISAACTSNIGNERDNNEDNFYFDGDFLEENNTGINEIKKLDFTNEENKIFAIFDGMGGQANGERASFLAASTLKEYINTHKTMKWDKYAKIANEKICNEMNNKRRMGSTMAAIEFNKEKIVVSNLGDSRIYTLSDLSFGQQSVDHTEEKLGERIKGNTGKSRLTQYLGIKEEEMIIQPEIRKIDYEDIEKILICSDGITDMINDDEIEKILANNEDSSVCVELLLDKALNNGGIDNTTLMVFSISKKNDTIITKKSFLDMLIDKMK